MWSIKFSLVARDTVCSTIAAGGLRIQRLGSFNQALMGKWLCDLGLRSHIYGDLIVTKYVEEWLVGLRVRLEYLICIAYGGVLVGARALCSNLCLLRWGTTLS